MDITRLKRNPTVIQSYLQESKSKQLITSKPLILNFPKRYVERGMGMISVENYVFGIFALIDEAGNYCVSLVPSMIKTSPSRISEIKINEVPHYNFHYNAGAVVIDNTEVVRKDTLIYSLMDEFFLKGNVPWFVGYEDLGKIFDGAEEYADSKAAQNFATMEALAAFISRDPADKTIQFRMVADQKKNVKPEYIGMYGNVFYAAPGTVAKLSGSYFQDGVVSALTQKSESTTHVEQLLRA